MIVEMNLFNKYREYLNDKAVNCIHKYNYSNPYYLNKFEKIVKNRFFDVFHNNYYVLVEAIRLNAYPFVNIMLSLDKVSSSMNRSMADYIIIKAIYYGSMESLKNMLNHITLNIIYRYSAITNFRLYIRNAIKYRKPDISAMLVDYYCHKSPNPDSMLPYEVVYWDNLDTIDGDQGSRYALQETVSQFIHNGLSCRYIVQRLINYGYDEIAIDILNNDRSTYNSLVHDYDSLSNMLIKSCEKGYTDLTRILIDDYKAPIYYNDYYPIIVAIENNNIPIANYLMGRVNIDESIYVIISKAAKTYSFKSIKFLHNKYNFELSIGNNIVLTYAIKQIVDSNSSDLNFIKYLIQHQDVIKNINNYQYKKLSEFKLIPNYKVGNRFDR